MSQKVAVVIRTEPKYALEDILIREYGDPGTILAEVSRGMDSHAKVDFVKQLIKACMSTHRSEDMVIMLEALLCAANSEFGPRVQQYLEELYWIMPTTTGDVNRPEPAFVKARVFICQYLAREWEATPTESSVRAFRRLIAMGWPLGSEEPERHGETVVEFKARGRVISDEEVRGIVDIVKLQMNSFGIRIDPKQADAVYGYWLRLPAVPDLLRRTLTIGWSIAGGPAIAERSILHAHMLEGLPESGLNAVRDVAEGMRLMMRECLEIFEGILTLMASRDPHLDARSYLDRSCFFTAAQSMTIRLSGGCKTSAMQHFTDAAVVIEGLRTDGKLRNTSLLLEVDWHSVNAAANPFVRTWAKMAA